MSLFDRLKPTPMTPEQLPEWAPTIPTPPTPIPPPPTWTMSPGRDPDLAKQPMARAQAEEINSRLRRIETRMVRLMFHHGLDQDGTPIKDHCPTARPNSTDRNLD